MPVGVLVTCPSAPESELDTHRVDKHRADGIDLDLLEPDQPDQNPLAVIGQPSVPLVSSFGIGAFSPAVVQSDLMAAQFPQPEQQTAGTLDLDGLRDGNLDGWATPEPEPTGAAAGAAEAVGADGAGGAAPESGPIEPAPAPDPVVAPVPGPALPDCSGGGPC